VCTVEVYRLWHERHRMHAWHSEVLRAVLAWVERGVHSVADVEGRLRRSMPPG
jgi:hypothetical protein